MPTQPAGSSWASSSASLALPPLSALQAWVHRPQAIAKCSISDVYAARTLTTSTSEVQFASREVFMLNQFPCKMVELVGWVAGVEEKENTQIITLDDGDGQHVLPVNVRLSLVPQIAAPKPPATAISSTTIPAALAPYESKAARKARKDAEMEAEQAKEAAKAAKERNAAPKVYQPRDVKVGDVVRVIGRINEWGRQKWWGTEWVRSVYVEDGGGGRIDVVDPDQQFFHFAKVQELHDSVYNRPFEIPPLPLAEAPMDGDDGYHQTANISMASLASTYSDAMTLQSEMPSEISLGEDSALPEITKLRSSQLTDNTFRRYLLDHMMEEVRTAVQLAELHGVDHLRAELHQLLPEYPRIAVKENGSPWRSASTPQRATPRSQSSSLVSSSAHVDIPAYTVDSLLAVRHLGELAGLIADAKAKKDERDRRRRLRDGQPSQKDKRVEDERRRQGLRKGEWRLSKDERRASVRALVNRALRSAAEEGSVVEVTIRHTVSDVQLGTHPLRDRSVINGIYDADATPTKSRPFLEPTHPSSTIGYLALPPPLLLPLVAHHLAEAKVQLDSMFISPRDPRLHNGQSVDEIVRRMRRWGTDGRWERLGEWRVEEAVGYGMVKGMLRREGRGYWCAER